MYLLFIDIHNVFIIQNIHNVFISENYFIIKKKVCVIDKLNQTYCLLRNLLFMTLFTVLVKSECDLNIRNSV